MFTYMNNQMKIEMVRGKAGIPARFWESCYIENPDEYYQQIKAGYFLRDKTDVVSKQLLIEVISKEHYTSLYHDGKQMHKGELINTIKNSETIEIEIPEFSFNHSTISLHPKYYKYTLIDGFFFKLPNPRF